MVVLKAEIQEYKPVQRPNASKMAKFTNTFINIEDIDQKWKFICVSKCTHVWEELYYHSNLLSCISVWLSEVSAGFRQRQKIQICLEIRNLAAH